MWFAEPDFNIICKFAEQLFILCYAFNALASAVPAIVLEGDRAPLIVLAQIAKRRVFAKATVDDVGISRVGSLHKQPGVRKRGLGRCRPVSHLALSFRSGSLFVSILSQRLAVR